MNQNFKFTMPCHNVTPYNPALGHQWEYVHEQKTEGNAEAVIGCRAVDDSLNIGSTSPLAHVVFTVPASQAASKASSPPSPAHEKDEL